MSDAQIFELLLRGVSVGALLAVLIGLARSPAERSLRLASTLFWGSAICYVLIDLPHVERLLGPAVFPVYVLQVGAAGYLWMFFRALFEDRPLPPLSIVPALLLTGLAVGGYYAPRPSRQWLWIAHYLIQFALTLDVLRIVIRSWRGDLVEARRRLRGPLAAAATLYMISVAALNFANTLGFDVSQSFTAMTALLALLSIASAYVFLDAREVLFGAARSAAVAAPAPPAADTATLARLTALMDGEQVWRQEGLTIGALAEAVATPEHRLRSLINDHLGHRNFAAFVNERRIAAAKAALADPAGARTTVAAIAYEHGFGSLGPFNRAFREATGVTPTEFRRAALAQGSPIPANLR